MKSFYFSKAIIFIIKEFFIKIFKSSKKYNIQKMENNSSRKIILVTGSNKGIGYSIIEVLLKQNTDMNIILSSRNQKLGETAVQKLLQKYPKFQPQLFYHQLDITKKDSIISISNWIKEKFGKINILFNNAGVYQLPKNEVIETNVFGTINITEYFLKNDLISNNGKIINVGSDSGSYSSAGKYKNNFKSAKSINDLLNLANQYLSENWSSRPYSISKLIIHIFSRILGEDQNIQQKNIGVYSMHPGWCKTDMGGSGAPLPAEHGAEIGIFIINLPDGINKKLQGKYFDEASEKVTEY